MTLLQLGIIIVGVTAIPITAYFWGRSDGARGPKAELEILQQAAQSQRQHYEARLAVLTKDLSHAKSVANKRKKAAVALAETPAYQQRQCLDDDGVRIANEALANAARYAADAVCSADTVDGRPCINGASKTGGSRGPLQ